MAVEFEIRMCSNRNAPTGKIPDQRATELRHARFLLPREQENWLTPRNAPYEFNLFVRQREKNLSLSGAGRSEVKEAWRQWPNFEVTHHGVNEVARKKMPTKSFVILCVLCG